MICVEHFDGDEGNAMTAKLDPNENVNLPTFYQWMDEGC